MNITCPDPKIKHFIDLDIISQNAVIVDIGASTGEFINSISSLPFFNTSKIFAFEPSKYNAQKLRNKQYKNVTVIEKAVIGSRQKTTAILTDFISKNDRFHQRPNLNGEKYLEYMKNNSKDDLIRYEEYDVSCISFLDIQTIIKQSTIDYLKIDVEGTEKEYFEVIKDMKLSNYIKQISIEWHYGENELFSLLPLLRKMGFTYILIWKNEIYAR